LLFPFGFWIKLIYKFICSCDMDFKGYSKEAERIKVDLPKKAEKRKRA
jgi:hypothetical protein